MKTSSSCRHSMCSLVNTLGGPLLMPTEDGWCPLLQKDQNPCVCCLVPPIPSRLHPHRTATDAPRTRARAQVLLLLNENSFRRQHHICTGLPEKCRSTLNQCRGSPMLQAHWRSAIKCCLHCAMGVDCCPQQPRLQSWIRLYSKCVAERLHRMFTMRTLALQSLTLYLLVGPNNVQIWQPAANLNHCRRH